MHPDDHDGCPHYHVNDDEYLDDLVPDNYVLAPCHDDNCSRDDKYHIDGPTAQ
jgi:hypothetical protein